MTMGQYRPGNNLLRASLLVFAIVGLSLFLTGCVYLLRDEFMPYHAEAIQTDWERLDRNLQGPGRRRAGCRPRNHGHGRCIGERASTRVCADIADHGDRLLCVPLLRDLHRVLRNARQPAARSHYCTARRELWSFTRPCIRPTIISRHLLKSDARKLLCFSCISCHKNK